jgi:hypothetical protein
LYIHASRKIQNIVHKGNMPSNFVNLGERRFVAEGGVFSQPIRTIKVPIAGRTFEGTKSSPVRSRQQAILDRAPGKIMKRLQPGFVHDQRIGTFRQ